MRESAVEFDNANIYKDQRKKYCGFDIGIYYDKKETIYCQAVCK